MVHHVGLTVSDLDMSIAYYCAILDCTVRERSQSSGSEIDLLTGVADAHILTADLELRDGGIVELIQYVTPPGAALAQHRNQPGHTHIAFRVDHLDTIHDRLVERGVGPTSPPVTINEPGSAWDGVRAVYTCDPDGRTVEFLELPKERMSKTMSTTTDVGHRLVDLCRQGKARDAINSLYGPDIVSIEAQGIDAIPARVEGFEAVRGKNDWWEQNHDVHGCEVDGPYPHGNRFIVRFKFDVTAKTGPMAGQRMKLDEIALYTVEDGKIVQEEFFYDMGG